MKTGVGQLDSGLLTIEEFAHLPDDGWRRDLVQGRVVREPPGGFRHGRIAARIVSLLYPFVCEHGLGEIVTAETGFVLFDEPPTVRSPDIAFVTRGRLSSELEDFAPLAPDLAIEIVSPSNTISEIHAKVIDYLEAGTRLVWVVEPRSRSVTTYRSREDIRLLTEAEEIEGQPVLPGFRTKVSKLFRE
jgi:Uma2 family endonuclease